MDKKFLNNKNFGKILEDHSVQEPGLSYNLREFGPYRVGTRIERLSDGYGGMGGKLVHSVDLPEESLSDEEIAKLIAKELQVDPSEIMGINPGNTWIKGKLNFEESNGTLPADRFKKLKNIIK